MDTRHYQELAARTLISKPDFKIPDDQIMIVWNAIGLVGEVGEVVALTMAYTFHQINTTKPGREIKTTTFIKELGDALWYVAALCTKLGLDMSEIMSNQMPTGKLLLIYSLHLSINAGEVAELVKKGVFHQHGIDKDKFKEALNNVLQCIVAICQWFDLDMSEVMQTNIDKLQTRYPDGYSSEDSQKRVDVE